ncbi:MAG TPA: hypothetical protein VHY56_07820, partial [Candidatus Binataceae bacterium]|nr:hypothetical protein [Candidatus Binataceae bacterium]
MAQHSLLPTAMGASLRLTMLGLIVCLLTLAAPIPALAMRVGGTLITANGQPLNSRDLHFQNCVTYDLYLS